jgi:hypothetical protein
MLLNKLGNKLVKCNLKCEGVNNNPKEGIIPRCLIPEKRKGVKKCIVVGLNPGKCKKDERQYYLSEGIKFTSLSNFFFGSKLKNRQYYKRTRDLLTGLGFDGNILWTDLAKCECLGKNGCLPVQTYRTCINRFLRKEIEVIKYKTIFALGNKAFEFCALSFPNHFVIGLPHPSGTYGEFAALKKKIASNKRRFINEVTKTNDNNGNPRAVHLSKI